MKANAILTYTIQLLTHYLEELAEIKNEPSQEFLYGEKLAYTECLEILLLWKKSEKKGLKFDVEQKFPL